MSDLTHKSIVWGWVGLQVCNLIGYTGNYGDPIGPYLTFAIGITIIMATGWVFLGGKR